jgi:hypothetical protein
MNYFASCPVRPSAGNSPRRKNPAAPSLKREAEEDWAGLAITEDQHRGLYILLAAAIAGGSIVFLWFFG